MPTYDYLLETVRIRIRIKQSDPDPYQIEKQDPDPYQSEKQDPDPYQSEKQDPDPYQKGLDPQHWLWGYPVRGKIHINVVTTVEGRLIF